MVRTLRQERIENSSKDLELILLCPGPVMVSSKVKGSMANVLQICHREDEFEALLANCQNKLNYVFGANPVQYSTIIITGSGTSANESVFCSYGVGKKLLIITNGEFGDRLERMAQCYKIEHRTLDFGWGKEINIPEIESLLASKQFDALVMVHHETSTGMLNPISEVGAISKKYDIDFIVDAISSLGAESLSLEKDNITFCTSSASKAIASYPGLSFVCGRNQAFESLKEKKNNSVYLDLYSHFVKQVHESQSLNTPAVPLFYALNTALEELIEVGINNKLLLYSELSKLLRNHFKKMGLKFVISENSMSRVLTTVYYPDNLDIFQFHKFLKEKKIVIYKGKGPLEGRAFQVANIGSIQIDHLLFFISVLQEALQVCKKE